MYKTTKKYIVGTVFLISFIAMLMLPEIEAEAAASNADRYNEAMAGFEWIQTGLPAWDGSSVSIPDSSKTEKVIGVNDAEYDAYPVTTPEEFRWAIANRQHMRLMNDLDMGGVNWVTVTSANTAAWVIDGNNHTIYNLNIRAGSDAASYGLLSITGLTPNFLMKDLTFINCRNTDRPNGQYKSILGRIRSGSFINVGIEDSIVHTSYGSYAFGSGLMSGYLYEDIPSYSQPLIFDNCYTKNVMVYASAAAGQCVASINAGGTNVQASNCYAIDGAVMANGGHSGGLFTCATGGVDIKNCFTNVDVYAPNGTGGFYGIIHHGNAAHSTFKFSNCYSSGKVEGANAAGHGGFLCGPHFTLTRTVIIENCYTTAGIGLDSTAANLGGFRGQYPGFTGAADNNFTIRNCYAAGEVGTESSTPDDSIYGFTSNDYGVFENTYYDKQTTAAKEKKGPGGNQNNDEIKGVLTKELMKTYIDGKSKEESEWFLSEGAYPQLKVFAYPDTFIREEAKQVAEAYSQASVSTAILYPSSLEDSKYNDIITKDPGDYDTVRSIRHIFPLTNNHLIGNRVSEFDMTWETDGADSPISEFRGMDVITLSEYPDYKVVGTIPGVSTLSVEAAMLDEAGEKTGIVGKRNQRLIPRNAFALSDLNRSIYHVRDETARNVWETDTSGGRANLYYNMKLGIMFSYIEDGKPITDENVEVDDLDENGLAVWAVATDEDGYEYYYITNPDQVSTRFTGNIKVFVGNKSGNLLREVPEELNQLLQGERTAELEEVGEKYILHYKWYKEGFDASDGVIERSRTLAVKLAPEISYHYYVIDNNGSLDKDYIYKDAGPYTEGAKIKKPDLTPDIADQSYQFKGWAYLEHLDDLIGEPGDFDQNNPAWYDPDDTENADKILYEDRNIWGIYDLVYLGSLRLEVSDTAIYGKSEAEGGNPIRNSLMQYPVTEMQLGVIDDRISGKETWRLTATLTEGFQNTSIHAGHTLNDVLVYSKGGQEETMTLGKEVFILSDKHDSSNSTAEGYYDVMQKWYEHSQTRDGLYIKVRPGDIKVGTYKATVKWKLTDAP